MNRPDPGQILTQLNVARHAVVGAAQAIIRRVRGRSLVDAWDAPTEIIHAVGQGIFWAFHGMGPADVRRTVDLLGLVPTGIPALVELTEVGGVGGEWIHPQSERGGSGTLLYLHGGGYVFGSPASHRGLVSALAHHGGVSALSIDYRLAPENRFPAALDDARAAYLGLLEQGFAPGRIVVGGDSAGGGLALALALALRDAGEPLPGGLALISPWTDLAHTGDSIIENADTDLLVRPVLAAYAHDYLGDADPRDPYASPHYGDLAGLPPIFVVAGGREMLYDDALRLIDSARAAGVSVATLIDPDLFHVWMIAAFARGDWRRDVKRLAEFIAEHASASGASVTV